MSNDADSFLGYESKSRSRTIGFFLLGAAFAGICLLFISAFIWFQPDQLSLSDRYFPSPTATITPSPTLTPTSTLTPTPTPNLTATVQAFETTATSVVSQWIVLLSDTFDANENQWMVGTDDDEYANITREIENGKYRWDATAHKGFTGWVGLETKSVSDFYLTLQAREAKNPTQGDYGLIFREDQDGNFYYFAINHDQAYFVSLNYNGEWINLITPTHSQEIRPVGFNHLTIVGQGSHFIFFINDQYVADITDDRIKTGTTALAISLSNTDDQTIFEFDNVELRVP